MPVAAEPNGVECEQILSLANVTLVQGSYHAAVSARFTMFTHTSGYDLTYWVACDLNSTFDIRDAAA